jgi:hypothetical protein
MPREESAGAAGPLLVGGGAFSAMVYLGNGRRILVGVEEDEVKLRVDIGVHDLG